MDISDKTLQALVDMAKAHGIRSECRQAARAAKIKYDAASKEYGHMGGFQDCGDFYKSEKDEAKGAFDAAVSREIGAERAYKKARLTAIETNPGIEPLIERFVHDASAPKAARSEAA
jgi:hypothetical protein